MTELESLQERALQICGMYDELNLRTTGRAWTREDLMLGFVGDVGDLAKQVMAAEGRRELPGGREALAHELADCLWSVLVLARRCDFDLAAEFTRTMAGVERRVAARLDALPPAD
ncbi:MazG nucleotide pyrophosphohydrolase domain-containing protein [Catellatospora aurea]|uniref:MazG nucleotide pyrophosphohydrolase domain-containing protein n=1 Tax=Catellatospora aurea TaxID=1337874 RepID=A0ABW2H1G1_9ACTN